MSSLSCPRPPGRHGRWEDRSPQDAASVPEDPPRRSAHVRGRPCAAGGGSLRGMPQAWIGLTLAFVSALVTNTAYSLEHDAAVALPPLSPRRPFRSAKFLLRDRRWLIAFAAESAGWLMYVAALRLAPLALVQAVTASGVAVLAFATARGHPSRLAPRERLAVVLAIAGLTLLALSLVGTTESDRPPAVVGITIWLAACGGGAALLVATPAPFARAFRARGVTRSGRRPAVRRRRHLREAHRLRREVAHRAPHPHRRLRRRHQCAAVGIPAGRRADGRRHGDDGDQRGPDRGRVRSLPRNAATRDTGRPADRGVHGPRGERRHARAPAGAPCQRPGFAPTGPADAR